MDLNPQKRWLYRFRRRLATAVILVLAGPVAMHIIFNANGMVVYRSKQLESRKLQLEILAVQKENQRLMAQISALRNGEARTIEKEAREQLHYARPGEIVYTIPLQPSRNSANAIAQKP